jgi:NAD(P)-dependent dehydrogenase (short-subunit alcohol dehydrogenase family)
MTGDFAGKVVLVSGAARGLGRATAAEFGRRGAALALLDVNAERLERTHTEFEGLGFRVASFPADVSSKEACDRTVQGALAAFGRLDVLCNVAATLRFHSVEEISAADWERVLGINLSGALYLSQAAIPHLLATAGNIVNVTSQAALLGAAFITAYATSKAALLHLTRCMAMEYIKQPIRINAVSPGTMLTEIGEGLTFPATLDQELTARYAGIRPPCVPEDVAQVIVFVASEQAKVIHGACIPADQGTTTG